MKIVRKVMKEEAPTNSVGTGENMAGLTSNPPVSKKNQKKHQDRAAATMIRRPAVQLMTGMFAGKKTFKVASHVYENVVHQKKKGAHWTKYLKDDEHGRAIREYANRNPHDPIILEDEKTGYMVYARYGRK